MNFLRTIIFLLILILCLGSIYFIRSLEFIEVSGDSMEDALFNKDIILIKKRKLCKDFKHGDILVFKDAYSKKILIKRCIATNNDSVLKITRNLFIPFNDAYFPTQKNIYEVQLKDSLSIFKLIEELKSSTKSLNFHPFKSISQTQINLSQYNILKQKNNIKSLNINNKKIKIDFLRPYINQDWLSYIFSSADLIKINQIEISLNNLKDYLIVLDSNSYFVIGDNILYSYDSRYFGPISEKNIIGKATFVLFNYHNGKFYWSRFLKRIE